jgi:hypothetical protein
MRKRLNNVGILPALCVAAVALGALTGCDTNKGKLLVADVGLTSGGAMVASVVCLEGGSLFPVDSATVTVNGLDVPPSFLGNISFSLVPAAAAGDDVTMHFSFDDVDILKTLKMPAKPTAVTKSATTVSTPITINWSGVAGPPNNIVVSVSFDTVSGDPFSVTLPGTATTCDIPANTLLSGKSITVIVAATNSTTNLGSSVTAGSFYLVENQEEVNFTSN